MNLKEVCEALNNEDWLEVSNYVPYCYEVKMLNPNVWKSWERDMWIAQWEKQDVLRVKDTYYGTIEIYSLHPITLPTKKKIFDTTYKFEIKERVARKVGGVEQAIKTMLEKWVKVSSITLRECFTYKSEPINFKYKDYNYVPTEISEYITYRIWEICKEHNIQYYYNFNLDQLKLYSFNPIPQEPIQQIKNEFGEYIKNENC